MRINNSNRKHSNLDVPPYCSLGLQNYEFVIYGPCPVQRIAQTTFAHRPDENRKMYEWALGIFKRIVEQVA